MNRRDTIIIAVLVNAGLLMVLFVTAMRSDEDSHKKITQEKPIQKKPLKEKRSAVADKAVEKKDKTAAEESKELDKVLHQYAKAPTFNENADEILLSTEEVALIPAQDVLEDAIAAVQEEALARVTKSEALMEITVKKGDVLEKIARTYQTSVSTLMEVNHLSSVQLKVGQVLKVPAKEGIAELAKAPNTYSTSDEFYIVKEGDNPWMIATKNKIKWEDLLKLNGLDEQRARRLKPGDKLRLR